MAITARIGALTDELISAIASVPDKVRDISWITSAVANWLKNTPRFQRLKKIVNKTLKDDTSLSTNPFEVRRRLEGLQEKFLVIGNEELADILRVKLDELDTNQFQWAPDILALFLELSDKPATRIDVETLKLPGPQQQGKPENLTWSEIEEPDTFAGQEDIWQDINYSADTSDDSESLASSDVSIPRIIPQSSKVPLDEYIVPDDLFVLVEDEDLVAGIQDAQAFQQAPQGPSGAATVFLSELQVIREVLHMLQGLPTALFSLRHGGIEIDRRFALEHISNQSFVSLLQSFSSIGTRILHLRTSVQKPQRVSLMQMFQRELERCLSGFDRFLSNVQQEHLMQAESLNVSLMQLIDNVRRESSFLIEMAGLVSKLKQDETTGALQCLDLLYDLICSKQAAGEIQESRLAVSLFSKCFEIYLKPIQLWMERGELDPALGPFFVTGTEKDTDLRHLWHGWYGLEESSGSLYAPKFLHPASRKIFRTGKSIIFLRHLGAMPETLASGSSTSTLTYDDICPQDEFESLLPFSGLLGNAFDRLVNEKHGIASSLLRKQLDERCGLWISLQALEYLYLGRDLSRLELTDRKVFELVDRGSQSWNDRFLLTELVQEAFGDLSCIDASRLIVRSRKMAFSEFTEQSRSVRILEALSTDYVLPWPVANIITKEALASYQRISTFLMQIRRPKRIMQRQFFLLSHSTGFRENESEAEDTLAFCVRHRLLWFLNTMYSHVTELVISSTTANMLQELQEAVDVDAMIEAHKAYMTSLEDQCLLSNSLFAIYDAVISILDLCIHFSDIQASRNADQQFDQTTNRSFDSSTAPRRKTAHAHRGLQDEYNSDEETEHAEDSNADAGNATYISFGESSYKNQLLDVKAKFDRLVAFIAGGLRGIGRVEGKQSWEILADKLEWRKESFAFS